MIAVLLNVSIGIFVDIDVTCTNDLIVVDIKLKLYFLHDLAWVTSVPKVSIMIPVHVGSWF